MRVSPLIRHLARDNLVLVVQYGVGSLVPLLLIPHIVRHIGLETFGELAIALAGASFGGIAVQYAFHLTGPRQLTVLAKGVTPSSIVCAIGSAKLVLLVAVWLLMGLAVVGWTVTGHAITVAQGWLMFTIPLAAALHTGWHLQTAGRFATVSSLAMTGAALALLVGFVGVRHAGPDAVTASALALSVAPLWTGAATFLASLRHLKRGPEPHTIGWRSPWTELRDGLPLFGSQFAAALYGTSGPLLVGAFAGAAQAGAFAAIERVSGAAVSAFVLTHTAAYPRLVQLYSSDRAGYRRLVMLVTGTYLVAAITLVIAVVFAWRSVLLFVFGPDGPRHGALLALALLWITLGVFGTVLTGYLVTSGQGDKVLPLTLKILAVSVALGVPGVLTWGAWAWLASLCASQAIVAGIAVRTWLTEFSSRRQ